MRAEDNSQMTTLSQQSFEVVMTAIKHAKLKGHSQVQPLHVAAALLDPFTRSAALQNACLQSLKEPLPPLKCDALDLCFKVALDRLPVITDPDKCKEQTMSNALGAALKRAHANERRGTPEQSLQPLLAVKTGIAHLTISILDDPSVSRVFREAGFSSTSVKLIMEEQVAKVALAGPIHAACLDNPGARRMQVTMPRFCVAPDGGQFRNSLFPGRLTGGDPSYLGSPLNISAASYEGDIRNIVETTLAGPKKRNPVLVSAFGSNSVLNELSQRLIRGDIPKVVPGVRMLDLPFTSLSVGILSEEVFERKLAKLKRDVDGYMQTGGAILSVGDILWLLEPSHSLSALISQELQRLVSSNANNRFWLLASASSKTWERCRVSNQPLLDSLAFHPVVLSPDGPGPRLQPRHGSFRDAEVTYLAGGGKLSDVKPAAIHSRLEKSDCYADCNRNFEHECSSLIKEEQNLCLGLGSPSAFPKFLWMQNHDQKGTTSLPVKEEESLVTNKIEELRHEWQQRCSTHDLHSGFSRDHSESPVAEIVPPPERNSRMSLSMVPNLAPSRWVPQESLKISGEKSSELGPLHSRIARGNIPNSLSGLKPATNLKKGEPETRRGDVSHGSPLSLLRREPGGACGPTLNMRPKVLIGKSGHSGASVGTDLALGRSATVQTRDLREEGQHPLDNRLQQPNNPKRFTMVSPSAMMRSSDTENLNGLCWSLSKAVPWQKEAVGLIASAVMKCRSGEGRKTGPYPRSDTWLTFLGPDRVGKREVAKALARNLCRSEEGFILLAGWQTDATGRTASSAGILAGDSNGMKYRGKTPLDRLVEALQRKPFSVVLVEDIDRADSLFKKNLVKAMDRGRLVDSIGREVTLANVIVIVTCSAGANLLSNRVYPRGSTAVEFDEESLSEHGPHEVRLFTDTTASVNVLHTRGEGLSIVDSIKTEQVQEILKDDRPAESILLFGSPMLKRKADSNTQGSRLLPGKVCKREDVSPGRAFSLDLNLSVEENVSEEDEEPCITDELSEVSEPKSLGELAAEVIECARGKCPAEMFSLSDASVIFKPFNLNGVTDWVFEKLGSAFQKVLQTEKVPVEIDRALLEVMVSYAWKNFSNPDAFQGWVDDVLMRAVSGLFQRGHLPREAILKLIAVETIVTMTPEFADCGSSLGLKVDLLPRMIQVDQ